jgi:ribosomal protein S18 acetylase RimI-like enzyme
MGGRSIAKQEQLHSHIRPANERDFPMMHAFARVFWEQTLYYKAGVEYDVDTCTDVAHACVNDGLALLVEDDQGKVIGIMMVLVMPVLMNRNHLSATEWVFYVDPDWRESGLGQQLLDLAETSLRIRGVKLFNMVLLENVTPEAARGLYLKTGFELAEETYMKDIS